MKNATIALSLMAVVVMLASGSAIAGQPGQGRDPIKIPAVSRDGTMAPLDEIPAAPRNGTMAPLDEPPAAPPQLKVFTDETEIETLIKLLKEFRSGSSESQQCCYTDCDTYQNRCVTVCGSC